MAEENETIESLKLKLKNSEEKNKELTNKINELNTFIQKQSSYIQKLREDLNAKEIILQQQKNGIEKNENSNSNKEKSPKTPLSIKTSFPNQGKISYKYSKFASPTADGSFSSFSPIFHVEHMRHSSTEDNLSNKNTHGRKLSQASQLAKETKFSVSENNIMYDSKESIDSINKNNKNEDNESIINNSLNEFEDKEIFADQITVYIQKLVFCKNDRNKRDIAFIISIRNSDSGDELWRIQKSYNDIQNLENIV